MATYTNLQEKSMDDILTSIRRVISEDLQEEGQPSSKIIELTQMVQDDGSIVDIKKSNSEASSMTIFSSPEDTPSPIFPSSMTDREIETKSSPAEPQLVQPLAKAEQETSFKLPPSLQGAESLISQSVIEESVAALSRLTHLSAEKKPAPSPIDSATIGQRTLEDLMRELLIPLLKNWLDANLPSLVKWIVTEEIQKILQKTTAD